MTGKIASSRESLSASTAWVGLDGLLRRRRRLLRHVLHVHVRHLAHVGHVGEARERHGGGHGVWYMHRRLHVGGRRVGSCDVRVGVSRVLGAVGRGGLLHTGFVLNEGGVGENGLINLSESISSREESLRLMMLIVFLMPNTS